LPIIRRKLSQALGFVYENAKNVEKNNIIIKERGYFSLLLIGMLHGGEIFKNEG